MQHSCPTIGLNIDDGAPTDPDPYPSDHRTLVRVISGAWDKLARVDPAKAHGIGEDGSYATRLYINGSTYTLCAKPTSLQLRRWYKDYSDETPVKSEGG